jgi:hypothetical protein
MSWKNIFLEQKTEETEEVIEKPNRFPSIVQNTQSVAGSNTPSFIPLSPSNTPSFTPSVTPSFGTINSKLVNEFLEMYNKGFESLNQNGYDFYEFFKGMVNNNSTNNPQMYGMAMSMAMAMEPTLSKEKLLTQADFYLTEIGKVYDQNNQSGLQKKTECLAQQETEKSTLIGEIDNLTQQREAISNQISAKQNQLLTIDSKYIPQITSIEEKLSANEMAKNNIVSEITTVKNGILNNIK